MLSFEKFNRGNVVLKEGVDLQSMEFKKLREFEGVELNVEGFFFTNGDYGKQVVVVANGYKINMPIRAVEQFESIMNDEESKQGVIDGHLMIVDVHETKTTKGRKTIGYKLKTK